MSNGSWTWSPEPGPEPGGGSGSPVPGHVPPSPVSPGSAPGYGSGYGQPTRPGYGSGYPGSPATPQPPVAPPTPEAGFASQLTVAMPGARPGVQTWPLEGAPAPRRRRTGLWVGAGIGVVALVGAGVAGWFLVGSKLVAPASPTAAVDRFVGGLEHKDGLAMLGALSPAEVQPFRQMVAEMGHDTGLTTPDPTATQAFTQALDSLTVSVDGLQLQQESLDDGLAKVSFTAGTLTVDGDPEQIADAVVAAVGAQNPLLASDPAAMHDEIVASLTESLPYTVDVARDWAVDGTAPYLVTVREGRGWYVSPLMTVGEYAVASEGLTRGAMPDDADVAHPASPQDAAKQLAAALPPLTKSDPSALISVLPEAERRFVAVYLQPAITAGEASSAPFDATLTASDFEVTDSTSDRAFVVPTDLAYSIVENGVAGTASFDGDCLTAQSDGASGTYHGCLSDVPLLTELGLDHPALVTVKEDGGWYVSMIGTYAELVRAAGENLARLQQEGKLDDPEWLQQQLPGLVGLLGGAYDAAPYAGEADLSAFGGAAAPVDPALTALSDACVAGDMASCDALYQQAPEGSSEWLVASTCGWRADVPAGGGFCSRGTEEG